jgi:hypothetical protein
MSTAAPEAPSREATPDPKPGKPNRKSSQPAETVAQDGVGVWGELPEQEKQNGPNSKYATELNTTAKEQSQNPGRFRSLVICKTARSASGRASTLKRRLRDGKVNGLDFDAKDFEIQARGSVVYARYTGK